MASPLQQKRLKTVYYAQAEPYSGAITNPSRIPEFTKSMT